MSPSWITPETAVETIEDLLALLMTGYTVELIPLDLLGPDRAVLRLGQQHGEAITQHEVRIATMRGLAVGIRELRVMALGSDDLADDQVESGTRSDASASLSLGMLAAMMGMGSESGDSTTPSDAAGSPKQVRATNPAGMAEAIGAALRPARVAPDSPGEPDS